MRGRGEPPSLDPEQVGRDDRVHADVEAPQPTRCSSARRLLLGEPEWRGLGQGEYAVTLARQPREAAIHVTRGALVLHIETEAPRRRFSPPWCPATSVSSCRCVAGAD